MDWVDIDGYNQKEHSAVDMSAPEHDEPLRAQDSPELSVTDVHVGDSAVDIGTGEAADDKPMCSSPTNKIFKIPPGISVVGSGIADMTFVSTDQMTFQVHRAIICARSSNDFGYVVQDKRLTINVPETSAILNAILCAIYDFPGEASLDTLKVAVGRMEKYGLTPSRFILPTKAAFVELCMHADQHPMDVFILAAKHDLDQVAQFASSHLLSFNLPSVTDEMAEEMGVMYLRRLFFLHMERLDRLKEYLTIEPVVHDALDTCEGNSAKRAWVFPAVSLITSGRHDISPEEITTAMVSSADELWCSVCCGNYMQQVSATVEMWSAVRSTI